MTLEISWIFTCETLCFIKRQQKSVPLLPKNGAAREKLFHSLGEFLEPSPAPAIHSPVRLRKQCTNLKVPDIEVHLFGPVMTEIITSLIDLFIKTCFNI